VRYLLDTDHISILQRRGGAAHATLSARLARRPRNEFSFPVVSFHEQAVGAHAFINRARTAVDVVRGYVLLMEILRGFSAAPVLPFDSAAAFLFEQLQHRGVRLATMGLRIASIALSRGLILLTRNAMDFSKVPGLATEDWTS